MNKLLVGYYYVICWDQCIMIGWCGDTLYNIAHFTIVHVGNIKLKRD